MTCGTGRHLVITVELGLTIAIQFEVLIVNEIVNGWCWRQRGIKGLFRALRTLPLFLPPPDREFEGLYARRGKPDGSSLDLNPNCHC